VSSSTGPCIRLWRLLLPILNGTIQRQSHRSTLRSVCPAQTSLTVGYHRVLKALEDITEHDLRAARHDLGVTAKLDDNPLQYVLMNLVDLLEAESEESQQRERNKAKVGHTQHVPVSQPDFDERPVTPQNTQSRFPISFEGTLDNKRKVSDTSFGSRSTETTPKSWIIRRQKSNRYKTGSSAQLSQRYGGAKSISLGPRAVICF